MKHLIILAVAVALFNLSPMTQAACVNKTAFDEENNQADLPLQVKESEVDQLLNNGFVRSACENTPQPNLQDAIQKCDAMKSMPEALKAGVFDQFNISIEEICRVSLDFLES